MLRILRRSCQWGFEPRCALMLSFGFHMGYQKPCVLYLQEKHPEIAQDDSVTQALEFPNLVVMLACFHAISICVFMVRVWFNFMLPDNIDAQHQVYQNLENAAARILMPYKSDAFAALSADLARVDEVESADSIPECVGVGSTTGARPGASLASGGVLSELPNWALPDDDSGLGNMIRDLVRTLGSQGCATACKVAPACDAGARLCPGAQCTRGAQFASLGLADRDIANPEVRAHCPTSSACTALVFPEAKQGREW